MNRVATLIGLTAALLATGCTRPVATVGTPPGPLASLQIIAFNDFHGHIDAGDQMVVPPDGPQDAVRVKAGGAVHFAAAIARLRADNPHSAVVTAGDLIGASPLVSGQFLDEPTIRVMNDIGIDYSALGNHEFDRGRLEIKRMQTGGCEKIAVLDPCQVMPDFPGANFTFLAGNTLLEDGSSLFPAYGIKELTVEGRTVRIGFVGLTLEGTPEIVAPKGVAGLKFAGEAETANALVPKLKAEGADILALLIHEGGSMKPATDGKDCANMIGGLTPILARLDPAFALVISGHTHQAYVCNYAPVDPARPFLVTSAGQYGTLLTRISLTYDFGSRRLIDKQAENLLVGQPEADEAGQPAIASLLARYQAAAASVRDRIVGDLGGPLTNLADTSGQSTLGNFVADAQLASVVAVDKGGAQIAFMNPGGLRNPITPTTAGKVRFGDLYAAQPFSNMVVVKQLSGAQIRDALEMQFIRARPTIMSVSRGFSYSFDNSRPVGQRISDIRLNGQPVLGTGSYRVAMNNFMGQGGDGFSMFAAAPIVGEGPSDVEALELYVKGTPNLVPPALDRIRNITPR